TTSETRVRRTGSDDAWRVLLPRVPEREYDVAHRGEHFYIRINDTGRNFRLIRMPVGGAALEEAEEIAPHRDAVMLEGHECFADWLILHERQDGVPQIVVRRFDDD